MWISGVISSIVMSRFLGKFIVAKCLKNYELGIGLNLVL